MLKANCFAHRCAGERDVVGRVHATSYLPCNYSWRLGETIPWGMRATGSPQQVVKRWMESPTHRGVILTPSFEHASAGVLRGGPGKRGQRRSATYTLVFGVKS